MYQDTDTRTAEITALIQTAPTVPAEIARFVPPPQAAYHPAGSPDVTGVVVLPNGEAYYGRPPVIYPQSQLGTSPAIEKAVERIGKGVELMGAGVCGAGVGFGVNEAIGALAGVSVGTAALLVGIAVLAKMKAPRQIINNIREENHYDQRVFNFARLFGRAEGSNVSDSSKTVINNT